VGTNALALTTVYGNTAVGSNTLGVSTTGNSNTGVGNATLSRHTTGLNNVAMGESALSFNTTSSNNTVIGTRAGYTNTTSSNNTYVGLEAGYYATSASNTMVGLQAGYATTTGSQNTFVGAYVSGVGGSGSAITTGGKNTILGGFSGNGSGLDIRTVSNRVVLSDGDGYPNMYFDDSSRRIENMGAVNGSGYRYKMRHWVGFQSAFDNPTVDLCTITGGGISSSAIVKVRVFQIESAGSSQATGNEHIGMASAWFASGAAHNHFVNTMTRTTTLGTTNVGTLSWVSNGNSNSTLRYTGNRASNYDTYYVEIEMVQGVGSNFVFITPT
jgi:hypothetical protein